MFQPALQKTGFRGFFATLELIFHVAVRDIRMNNSNAIIGMIINIIQSLIMVLVFVFMFTVLKMRGAAVRGDFLLYTMSGIFMYMTHIRAIRAVAKAEGPTSAMMKHAPMNTIVAIAGQAIAALYQQILAVLVILFFYHTVFNPVEFEFPVQAMGMLILAWISGVGVGMVFKAATPWAPDFFAVLTAVYTSANMIASGKMFLANALPTSKLFWFSWNPLFHVIDQTRGFVFLNYTPHYSNVSYPIWVTFWLIVIGLMGDTFTRQYASASWSAGR
jgi:ABC-type polysaccharide/polyol phosphate export permease